MESVGERLGRIEVLVAAIAAHQALRDWYSVEQFAALVGLAPFTVRKYCREGRLEASKRNVPRGRTSEWVISHKEYLRYQKDGLLPKTRSIACR